MIFGFQNHSRKPSPHPEGKLLLCAFQAAEKVLNSEQLLKLDHSQQCWQWDSVGGLNSSLFMQNTYTKLEATVS